MDIGQRIREKRKELNMSMEQLAQKLGVNRSTVLRYETGEIEKMPFDIIEPIAKALHTTPQYIMGWDEEEIESISDSQAESLNDLSVLDDFVNKPLIETFKGYEFTDDELSHLKEYADFLISKRRDS